MDQQRAHEPEDITRLLVEAAGHFDDALEREVVAASDRLVG